MSTYKDNVRLGSNTLCRTRSLKDGKTFTVFTELTKPSQSVVTMIGSVGAYPVDFALVIDLLQETIAGDAVSRTFRPDLPGNEYPTPNTKPPASSQDFEGYGEPMDRGGSQIVLNRDETYETRFSSSSPLQNKCQGKEPLAHLGRSNPREIKLGPSYGEWKPEQLSNGNYRRAYSLILGDRPLPCFRCNHTCKDRNNCRHIWYSNIHRTLRLTQYVAAVAKG